LVVLRNDHLKFEREVAQTSQRIKVSEFESFSKQGGELLHQKIYWGRHCSFKS